LIGKQAKVYGCHDADGPAARARTAATYVRTGTSPWS
jgi:hypothetical protein